jgi:hypothetical protein
MVELGGFNKKDLKKKKKKKIMTWVNPTFGYTFLKPIA